MRTATRRNAGIWCGAGIGVLAVGLLAASCGDGEPTAGPPQPDAGSGGSSAGDAGDAGDAGGSCTRDTECIAGQVCSNGRCGLPVTCTTSADCTGRICDLGTRRCVQCLSSSDCPPEYACTSDLKCVPAPPCENSLSCPPGVICDRVTNRCLECVAAGDCAPDEQCHRNVCRPRCDSDNDCRPLGLLCDSAAGNCVTCLDDNDCEGNRFCEAGLCRSDVCAPGSIACRDGGLAECKPSGSGYAAPSPCPKRQSCSDASGAARCEDQTCVPSTIFCDADAARLMSCAADGLSSAVAEDCAASDKACVAGACRTALCRPRQTFCSGKELQVCGPNGDTATRLQTCSSTQYCDAAGKRCAPQVCAPGAPVCDLNVARTCNADGSGYAPGGVDCSATSQLCSAGVCRTRVCNPGTASCKNGDVYYCSLDGLTDSLSQDCSDQEYCIPGSFGCYPRVCTPGAMACFDTTAARCNADGSGPEPGGTDCTAGGNVCSGGQCVPPLCTPLQHFCRNGDVHLCTNDALDSQLVQACSAAEPCTEEAAGASCKLIPIVESFEDGDYDGWTAGGVNAANVVDTTAANGTTRSLQLTGGNGTADGGLSRSLPSIHPGSISWWVRPQSAATQMTGMLRLFSSTGTSDILMTYAFSADGYAYIYHRAASYRIPYTADTWTHVELRNIHWGNRSFDWYVDGTLISSQVEFSGAGTAVGRIDLFQLAGACYFDEIEFR